jgi:hypothetical protein
MDANPTLRKVPADAVPYGRVISLNGKHVWVAYDGEKLVAAAASANEARRKYRAAFLIWRADV